MSLSTDDPFARFRSSMAASHADSPNASGSPELGTAGSSPGAFGGMMLYSSSLREGSFAPADDVKERNEDDALLRLVEEATAATDEPGPTTSGFIVTATSSSTVIPGSFSVYPPAGPSLTGPFAAPPPPPPPPPVSPPSFAETVGNPHQTPTVSSSAAPPAASSAAAHHTASAGVSPMVYHAATPTTPATPAQASSSSAVAESMIVRTHRGVFLLQPTASSSSRAASQSPCTHGASPPVSPLPTYALPPALPAPSGGGSFALGSSVGYAASKKAGLSPPQYASPPPYWKH